MATSLTFQPGRVPGLGQAAKARPARIGNLSARQHEALAALIHEPIRASESRAEWANVGAGVAWVVCSAVALVAGNSLVSHAVAAPANAVARQSSAAVNRTM